MKGTIVNCLQELVINKFGKEKWEKSLEEAGVDPNSVFLMTSDIDDAVVVGVIKSVCKNLGITLEQAADAFGDYWINVYAQKFYRSFFAPKTAKDFLLNMDFVHVAMTNTLKDSRPPRFTCEMEDKKTLVMHYKSKRGLIDFVVGLVNGVGKYYKENLSVSKIGADKVRIVFL
ncbi:MAG: heme NO-binding domain-containing protein [bacterium]